MNFWAALIESSRLSKFSPVTVPRFVHKKARIVVYLKNAEFVGVMLIRKWNFLVLESRSSSKRDGNLLEKTFFFSVDRWRRRRRRIDDDHRGKRPASQFALRDIFCSNLFLSLSLPNNVYNAMDKSRRKWGKNVSLTTNNRIRNLILTQP